MIELIAIIILFASIVGMGVIVFRKIPVLVELPEISPQSREGKLFLKLKEKIKIFSPFKYFSYKIFLQRVLSKTRILTLKMESKTANWLQKLRERSQKEKIEENDNYWKEIKKIKNEKQK